MKPHCPSHKQWYVGVNWKPIIYHMIITIDDNTHSGGVSLQPTKRRIVYNFFLPEWGKLLINDMFQRKKNWLIAFRLPFQWWFGELEKLIIRKKCIIAKLVTYSSGCIFPKRQQENWDLIHSSQGMIAINEDIANRTMQSFCITESLSDELTECIIFFSIKPILFK